MRLLVCRPSIPHHHDLADQKQTPVWAKPFIQAIAKAGFILGYVGTCIFLFKLVAIISNNDFLEKTRKI